MIESIGVDCLIEHRKLEDKVRSVLGDSCTLNHRYHETIQGTNPKMTPLYSFLLLHDPEYIQAVETEEQRRDFARLASLIRRQLGRDNLERFANAKRTLEREYVMEGIDPKLLYEKDRVRRIKATNRVLPRVLKDQGINVDGILNPNSVDTEGLIIVVNKGGTYGLIWGYGSICGLKKEDFKFPFHLFPINP